MNNDLFIQYSHSITWDYSKGILPSGREPAWDWEESYIPVEHKQGSRTLGKHEFMRVKVGVQGVWSVPMRIVGLGIKSVSTVLKSSSEGTKTYAIETTYDDGTVTESDSLLTIVDGKDGKDGTDAENFDSASEWFDTETDLKAFTSYVDNQYYGIFENRSIYQYRSGATVGIKPDDITGNGRYVLTSDLSSTFASEADMDENPMVLSTKAVAPSNLQYWWDNVKTDYYTGDEVDTLLSNKVDKETGKGLTTNDFTNTLKSKLDGIADGAEVNVNADWDAVSGDALILNKPSTFTPSAHNHAISDVTNLQDALDDKLDKSLTLGKIWVGDEDNLPSEIYPDALTGFATVGTGGQYLTMKSATDANRCYLVQVGNMSESDTYDLSKNVFLFGNKSYSYTQTGTITLKTGCLLRFSGVYFINNTNPSFSVFSGQSVLQFHNCSLSLNVRFIVLNASIVPSLEKCTITINSTSVFTSADSIFSDYRDCTFICNSVSTIHINEGGNLTFSGTVGDVKIKSRVSECYGTPTSVTFRVYALYTEFDSIHILNAILLNSASSNIAVVSKCSMNYLSGVGVFLVDKTTLSGTVGTPNTGSKFNTCTFSTTQTITSGIDLLNCASAGLTLSGTKNKVIGGNHTSIVVNGNSNEVSSCTASTSITLGAVTKCKITNNETPTEIVEVLGNTFMGNTLA